MQATGRRRIPAKQRPELANLVDGKVPDRVTDDAAHTRQASELPALAAVIGFCTLWRLPGLADPPWLNDEGVYASVGKAVMQGQALYRQIWENKPPGIYLLYGAVH